MDCPSSQFVFDTASMIEKRKTWALGNDVDLLNQLENFSRRLVDRTRNVLEKIEDFEKNLTVARIEVNTLSNNFESVADNQFVENRVYDEEEDIDSFQRKRKDLPSSTNDTKELEKVLTACANIIDSKFEAVNIRLSDSEDDADLGSNSETVYLPKNRYKLRPLPHLIGSQEFYNDDSLGILGSHEIKEHPDDNMNGDDETFTQSESSSIDEPDESSATLEHNINKLLDNEPNSLSDSKGNFDSLFSRGETIWKDTIQKNNNSKDWKEETSENYVEPVFENKPDVRLISGKPESIIRDESDDHFITHQPKSNSNTDNIQSTAPSGPNLKISIHDELKQLFAGDKKGKLKVLEKNRETIHVYPNNKTPNDSNSNSSPKPVDNMIKPVDNVIKPVDNMIKPMNNVIKPVDKSSTFQDILKKSVTTNRCQQSETVPGNNDTTKYKSHNNEERITDKTGPSLSTKSLTEDDLLPDVQTEILHSFGKERAKIKNKRRLPSRKQKRNENKNNNANNITSAKENLVLSPSTDEEDLFVLPQSQGKEPALFSRLGVFSPGSSIEGNSKSLISEDLHQEEYDRKDYDNTFDEPLGHYKTESSVTRVDRNKQLFKDWDPFDADDDDLFQSINKQTRKTNLFDDHTGSSLKSPSSKEDDMFYEKDDIKTSNLFGNVSASNSIFSSNVREKNESHSSRLFSDESDDDDDDDLFSKGSLFKSTFSSSSKENSQSKHTNISTIYKGPEKSIRREVHSNPLSDPDNSLFD